jgi:hypothetical protein
MTFDAITKADGELMTLARSKKLEKGEGCEGYRGMKLRAMECVVRDEIWNSEFCT